MKAIKKTLKYTLIFCLGFIIFTQVFDLIGWLSDEDKVEKSELFEIESIAPAVNGYEFVKFIDEPDFRLLKECCKSETLQELITKELWTEYDNNKATEILDKHAEYKNVIKQVISKKHFQSKIPDSFYDSFPSYEDLGSLFYLKLLEFRIEVEKQNFSQAIKLLEAAVTFSQYIKADESPSLISFLVGVAYQGQATQWIHRLGTRYKINNEQREKLITLTRSISDYTNDNFDSAIRGEFRFSELFFKGVSLNSLEERKKILMMIVKPEEENQFLETIENLMTLFSPHFAFQNGKVSNMMYSLRSKDIESIRTSCNKIDFSYYGNQTNSENSTEERSLLDFFKLNSVGKSMFEIATSFEGYFLRRCQADFHLQAVKTALAIVQFESINNSKITNLKELTPNIIDTVPIDANNGKPLLFNQDKRWLYSVGSNFSDDGGSSSSFYHHKCRHKKDCQDNPTVPIIHQTIEKEQ